MATMDSQSSGKKVSGSAEFTKHAEAQLKLDHPYSGFHKYDAARDGPRLVDVNSRSYEKFSNLIHQSYADCNISMIRQVYAPEMYGMYLLRKEEMRLATGSDTIKEYLLYKVTTESEALESLEIGLDWRIFQRSNKFGYGVSFSDDVDYANYYADIFPSEETRVIMICTVLVNETYMQVPWSVQGNSLIVSTGLEDAMMSHNSHVYVKINDNEFYPLCFVYFRNSLTHMVNNKYFQANVRRDIKYCQTFTLEQMCLHRLHRNRR